jgi:hypothetical protein
VRIASEGSTRYITSPTPQNRIEMISQIQDQTYGRRKPASLVGEAKSQASHSRAFEAPISPYALLEYPLPVLPWLYFGRPPGMCPSVETLVAGVRFAFSGPGGCGTRLPLLK